MVSACRSLLSALCCSLHRENICLFIPYAFVCLCVWCALCSAAHSTDIFGLNSIIWLIIQYSGFWSSHVYYLCYLFN